MRTKQVRNRVKMAEKFGFRLKRHKKHLVFQNDQGKIVVCPRTSRYWKCDKEFEKQLQKFSLAA